MADEMMDGEETDDSGLVTVQSQNSFDRTVQQLQDALTQQGLTIMAVLDHAANAQDAGLTLPPTTLILTGNPNLGTPLMQSSRSTAIDLPQKFLVWADENDDVFVTYNAPQYLADRHGIDDQDTVLGRIATALGNFASAATSIIPSVTVAGQAIVDESVVVAEAVVDGPGWVVIHADDDGAPGPVIGNSALLTTGVNSDIVVDINVETATDTLYAMLHTDAGEAGTYEFPGPDAPVQVDGQVVAPAFNVTTEAPLETAADEMMEIVPSATVEDQAIVDETVVIAEAILDAPGWVVIHADQDGAPGPVIGHSALLTSGVNSGVVVDINVETATDTLYAMLHIDAGEAGVYEFPGPDEPVQVDDEVITSAFTVLTE